MATFKNIVLTTDFSLSASAAVPFAVALAKRDNGTIHIFHAVEHEELEAVMSGVVIGASAWISAMHKERERKMQALANELEARHGVRFVAVCASGNPVKAVVKYAKKNADLIVISTHGRSGLEHLMMGSVAEHVTRLSEVPVLTVRPGEASPKKNFRLKNILLLTDFSRNAAAAEPYAVEFARSRGAKILLVHVVDDSAYSADEPIPASTEGVAMEDWMETLAMTADKKLAEKAERLARKSGVKVTPVCVKGRIAEMISKLVQAQHVDLIVMSTHGFTGLSRLLIGSNAAKVVQTSVVPVLSIKPSEL